MCVSGRGESASHGLSILPLGAPLQKSVARWLRSLLRRRRLLHTWYRQEEERPYRDRELY